jgi:two-component system response regulator
MKDRTLLYIEDNEDHAQILELTLRKLGIPLNFHWARSGEEALEYLFKKVMSINGSSSLPDLILIDLKLTKADGFSVIHRIKSHAHLKMIPVVVLTSSEDPGDVKNAYSNFANSYIAKSIETSAYRKQIESVVYYWMEVNCSPINTPDKE